MTAIATPSGTSEYVCSTPWQAPLPDGWQLMALRRVALSMCDGPFGSSLKSSHYTETGTRVIRLQNIGNAAFRGGDEAYIDPSYFASLGGHDARPGDLLVAGLGDENHPVGRACVLPEHVGTAMVKADCFRIRLNRRRAHPQFLAYFLSSTAARAGFAKVSRGATRERVNLGGAAAVAVPVPPLAQQAAIVDFLGRETARVDALVEKQEQLARRVEEKRRAVTAHAIMRGLRPGVPMKDSDIAWIGTVPEHWEVVRLRHLALVQSGLALGRKTEAGTVEVPYLRVANVQDGFLDLTEIKTVAATPDELRRHALLPGDVLMNEGGDNDKLGRGAIWRGDIKPCIHQNHVFAVRPHGVEPEWLTMVTGSDYAKRFFESRAKQTTNLASISSSNLREVPVVMPPPEERAAILHHLEQQHAVLDALRARAAEAVTLLREHRAALITAAVTGQIAVRSASTAINEAA